MPASRSSFPSDKSPSELSGLEDRVRTRLGCGMVATCTPPPSNCACPSWKPRPAAPAWTVPAKVLEFLAHKITTNVRELEGALNRLIASCQPVRPNR